MRKKIVDSCAKQTPNHNCVNMALVSVRINRDIA